MAISRLFSRARRIASFNDKYNLPSRISCVSPEEFTSEGSGVVAAVYALKGLRGLGISSETGVLVCAEAEAVKPILSHTIKLQQRSRQVIDSPPRAAAAPDSRCR